MYSKRQPSVQSPKAVRVLGIIPARGGSKSIPKKNIALLAGKPMIAYTIRAAQRSRSLDAFLVSTDDPVIAAVARRYGADVPFLRPRRFARDLSPDIEYLEHALQWVRQHRGWRPEAVVILRPTAPLRIAEDIDRAVRLFRTSNCDSVRTVSSPYPYNPFKMWVVSDAAAWTLEPLLRTRRFARLSTDVPRQLLPTVWWQNGFVEVTRASCIERGRVYGKNIRGLPIDPRRVIDIDEPKDLLRAARIMRELKVG